MKYIFAFSEEHARICAGQKKLRRDEWRYISCPERCFGLRPKPEDVILYETFYSRPDRYKFDDWMHENKIMPEGSIYVEEKR
jgi:hypothetical protein